MTELKDTHKKEEQRRDTKWRKYIEVLEHPLHSKTQEKVRPGIHTV